MVIFLKQIDRLKKRYDAMTAAAKKTGSVLYFKPLRLELNDCFGALKDVTPDQVFSNCKGMEEKTSNIDTDETQNSESDPLPAEVTDKKKKKKCK